MKHFETLEIRQLMSAAITDMTALAQTHAPHVGLTYLFLNFDGGTINDAQAGGKQTISAFQPETGQNRQQAIQDIIYRETEIFAPFNVEVAVMTGAGNFSAGNGNTTIFVGDNAANVDKQGYNENYSSTPANSMDYPTPYRGQSHVLNSDPYDIAFVDPVAWDGTASTTNWGDQYIAGEVAHEAGHTFGLAHVLSNSGNSVINEEMSYNATNQFFSNTTFNITDLNNNGSSTTDDPGVVPTLSTGKIKTQNSYTYLQAVLGPSTFLGNTYKNPIADTTAVDPTFTSTLPAMASLSTSTVTSGTVRAGEYDAYNFTHTSTVATTYNINVYTRGALSPQVFIYDSTGTNLITSFSGTTGQFTPNGSYKVVIGSYSNASFGSYVISFQPKFILGSEPVSVGKIPLSSIFSSTPISDSVSQQVLS